MAVLLTYYITFENGQELPYRLVTESNLPSLSQEIAAGHAQRVDKTSPLYCAECNIHFMNEGAFQVHMGSSSKHATVNMWVLFTYLEIEMLRVVGVATIR